MTEGGATVHDAKWAAVRKDDQGNVQEWGARVENVDGAPAGVQVGDTVRLTNASGDTATKKVVAVRVWDDGNTSCNLEGLDASGTAAQAGGTDSALNARLEKMARWAKDIEARVKKLEEAARVADDVPF